MSRVRLLILAALCLLAYSPLFFGQPFIDDDYPNIAQADKYGPPSGWPALAADPIFRVRATGYLLLAGEHRVFGMQPAGFYAGSLLLHILCVWLLYALGVWRPLGYSLAFWTAAFFAIYEGHQEAVMWISACNELLQFLFGVAGFYCWVRFLQGKRRWYAGALACFVLALISKESAVVFAGLYLLPLLEHRSQWRPWLPFGILALGSVWLVQDTADYSFRFHDGSFSLHAPFLRTAGESFIRLFWFWGLLALPLAWARKRELGIALAWIVIALSPYCFLLYSTRIPSRQTYLASAGLACVVACGWMGLRARHRSAAIAVLGLALAHNTIYLWTKKRGQFLERAAPIEALLAVAARTHGPIFIACIPRTRLIADEAVRLRTGKEPGTLVWDEAMHRADMPEFQGCGANFSNSSRVNR